MIHILFYLWKHRTNSKGEAPIYCRITIDKTRKQFSTFLYVQPKQWNSSHQRIIKHSNSKELNNHLHAIRDGIQKIYLHLHYRKDEEVTTQIIYDQYSGTEKHNTLLDTYDEMISTFEALLGQDYKKSTIDKVRTSRKHIVEVLKTKGIKDIKLSNLKSKFINDVYMHLRSKNYATGTINKNLKILKQVIKYAVKQDYLNKNTFNGYKLRTEKPTINYLTRAELSTLEKYVPKSNSLQQVKDCFLFSCYTGLAYSETKAFRYKHIELDDSGTQWIKVTRAKTTKTYYVPVLKESKKIIDKYQNLKQLPLISNQKLNDYIKIIAQKAGIKKKVSHHMARKTFATTVLLGKGIPMEVVSKLLGHSTIAITSSTYAHIDKSYILRSLGLKK